MLKGLALTPPVIGRISIGRVVEKSGRRLPEKDDEFTLTSQVQNKDGWVAHPMDAHLRGNAQNKLRSIPVRLLFDDPDLNLRASYTMFDRSSGRPLCVGDGDSCKRITLSGVQSLPCPSPVSCPLAQDHQCKPYGRLHVRVDTEESNHDELGSFVFRTTGFNSIRTLAARLRYLHAASGGLLASLPLELRLRGKSTTMSHRTPIYYVDLTVRTGTSQLQAIALARKHREQSVALGFEQSALDAAAHQGLALGEFEESEEEGAGVVEEFYPEASDDAATPSKTNEAAQPTAGNQTLRSKLSRRHASSMSMQSKQGMDTHPGEAHGAG